MDVSTLLVSPIKRSHEILGQVMADVDDELANRASPGTINSIAATFAHTVLGEDFMVNGLLRQQPPLFATGGYAATTGVPMPTTPMQTDEWANEVKMNVVTFREYAERVFAQTEATIASLSSAELEKEIDTGFIGKMSVAEFISGVVAYHTAEHTGEIAALKGVHGSKGLPF